MSSKLFVNKHGYQAEITARNDERVLYRSWEAGNRTPLQTAGCVSPAFFDANWREVKT